MPLRHLDLDSATRVIIESSVDAFDGVLDLCNAKLKEIGVKADPAQAVTKVARHAGRRNPLRGQKRGSGDLNVRGLVDFIKSIEPLGEAPADDADAATKAAYAEHAAAIDKLVVLQATLAAGHQ